MRPAHLVTAVCAIALVHALPAQAQFGHHRAQSSQSGPQQMNCAAIAANPAAGMDRASCEAMNRAAAAYTAAQQDPAGARPGDDALTCDQIKAELMSQPITAPPAQDVAAGQAAAKQYQATSAKVQAQVAAEMAAETVANAGVSAATALAPVGGNAIGGAAAAAETAAHDAMNARAQAEMQPAQRQLMSATGAEVGDMSGQLQDNPRLARLIALSQTKRCHGW